MAGGWLSLLAALLHLACIAGGEEWYRFFGAGEEIALAAARGEVWPHLITACIALVLAIWAAFAFSGGGSIRRLPLLRTALIVISAIYLARGLIIIPIWIVEPQAVGPFGVWSSVIVLVYGIAYSLGTALAWRALAPGQSNLTA